MERTRTSGSAGRFMWSPPGALVLIVTMILVAGVVVLPVLGAPSGKRLATAGVVSSPTAKPANHARDPRGGLFRGFSIEVYISPARCGPVVVNGTSQSNDTAIQLPSGNYALVSPACQGEEPWPTVLAGGGVDVNPQFDQIGVVGNGSILVTYFAPLNTVISGPSSAKTGSVVAFAVKINGGDQSYFELWSFGDGTTPVNATGGTAATHAYASPGTYLVRVWVNDTEPVRSLSTFSIVISGPASSSSHASGPNYLALGLVVAGFVLLVLGGFLVVTRNSARSGLEEGTHREGRRDARDPKEGSGTDPDRGASPRDQTQGDDVGRDHA